MRENDKDLTKYKYYIQIIGKNISEEFSFASQGDRDELSSILRVGLNDVQDFLNFSS